MNEKRIEFEMTLFDDEWTREKCKCMQRIEAMFDDSRNELPKGIVRIFLGFYSFWKYNKIHN